MSARVKFSRHPMNNVCAVCGASARRKWCRLHDPARQGRKQAHEDRVRRYQAKQS